MKRWQETRQVIAQIEAHARAGRRAALATVIGVRGSAYRREGAKLLFAEDGRTTGGISGGCIDRDICEVAAVVARSGVAQVRGYCSGGGAAEDDPWDFGLGCEGEVEVFVEPACSPRSREHALLSLRRPFAVCTLVGGEGAALGARLVVTDADSKGTLGVAPLDAEAVRRARRQLAPDRGRVADPPGGPGVPTAREVRSQGSPLGLRTGGWDDFTASGFVSGSRSRGQEDGRGGSAQAGSELIDGRDIFFETLLPPPRLVVCGAGEDARPLARLAGDVGFDLVVVDRRMALLRPERFPSAAALVRADGSALLESVTLEPGDHAIVMSHDFAADREYLCALLASPVAYIGLLGPRRRSERLLAGIYAGAAPAARATGADGLERVHAPVGLDLGAEGAEQIAVAVVAEMLARLAGRRPLSLREREASAAPLNAGS